MYRRPTGFVVPALLGLLMAGSIVVAPATSAMSTDVAGRWRAPVPMYKGHGVGVPRDVSCPTTDFCAAVATGGVYVERSGTWGPGRQVGSYLVHISCASDSWCVAANLDGSVTTYDGSSWSADQTIDAGHYILGLSCPQTTFCMASDQEGYVVTFDGTGWHREQLTDTFLADVSCVSDTFCVAVDEITGVAWMFDGSTWSESEKLAQYGLTTVSCASASWCVATDFGRTVHVWDGSGWSGAVGVARQYNFLHDVSCSSPTFCLAVDDHGRGYAWDGTGWTRGKPTGETDLDAVSCAVDERCEAVSPDGEAVPYDDGWGTSQTVYSPAGSPRAVSCASPRFCMAVDYYGNAIRFRHGRWQTPVKVIAEPGYSQHMQAVSCPSVDFCVALSTDREAVTYRNGSWSQPEQISTNLLYSLSCASETFCIAVGAPPNRVLRYDGSSWTKQSVPGQDHLSSVSCPSRSFCVAAAGEGTAYTYDGSVWSGPQQVAQSASYHVSCSSPRFCVMMSVRGVFSVFDGLHWSPQARISAHRVSEISCPIDGMCMIVTTFNRAFMYSGGAWIRSRVLDPKGGSFNGVSCPTSTFCTAVDQPGKAVTYDG